MPWGTSQTPKENHLKGEQQDSNQVGRNAIKLALVTMIPNHPGPKNYNRFQYFPHRANHPRLHFNPPITLNSGSSSSVNCTRMRNPSNVLHIWAVASATLDFTLLWCPPTFNTLKQNSDLVSKSTQNVPAKKMTGATILSNKYPYQKSFSWKP